MYAKLSLLALLVAAVAFYLNPDCFQRISAFFSPQKPSKSTKLFTPGELKEYNGIAKPQLYLAILGRVFDVSKGSRHYGPGETYNFFIGKDASRSFVTGKFGPEDADDHVSDLTPDELRSLDHWVKFYQKDYTKVGKLTGRYYDSNGKLTQYGKEVKKLIRRAESEKESQDLDKMKYPSCNVEWDSVQGSRVWCTKASGGVSRNWVGVPRQIYEPGSTDYRCACINPENTDLGNLKEYPGCDHDSESCLVK